MTLQEYKNKRDFQNTSEPAGKIEKKDVKKDKLIFVIQKHHASHLHYDFRLEMDGVLKSWAVPKGPCLDSTQKRLAQHVEDHPLEYAKFEGVIPKGQYGAGIVMIWDQGTYEPIGDFKKSYQQGKLEFILHGEKLSGKWSLVCMKTQEKNGDSWLLMKGKDENNRLLKEYDILTDKPLSVNSQLDLEGIAAKSNSSQSIVTLLKEEPQAIPIKKLPELNPELATLVEKIPMGLNWLHEVKYDGYRILAYFDKKSSVKLITRRNQDWTKKFLQLEHALQMLNLTLTIFDGELVAIDNNNRISFSLLQNSLTSHKPAKLVYYVFDMPICMGFDIQNLPLIKRKEYLKKILEQDTTNNLFQYSDHLQGNGEEILRTSCELGLEGVVSKELNSTYEQKRTKNWLKNKCVHRQEFLIIGYLLSPHEEREISSLLLGYYDEKLSLYYCGHVGTGFSHASLQDLAKRFNALIQKSTPQLKNFPTDISLEKTVWLKPNLIAEIKFSEWTSDGRLRHPVYLGLRLDKNPTEVTKEESKNSQNILKNETIKLTNPNKILLDEKKITKENLANYYLSMSSWILPYIINRPLMILRCPSGENKKCFFQKHYKDELLPGLYFFPIQEKEKVDNYIYIKDQEGILSLSQLGVIEIHIWGSHINNIEYPDQMVFDLDPGENVSWKMVIDSAFILKEYLNKNNLQCFVKTSGKKGLHIIVPLLPKAKWVKVKEFSRDIGTSIAKKHPNRFVTTMTKAKRVGKIFIDYFRNNRGSTTIAPYSCRANKIAGVSLPLEWSELNTLGAASDFDIEKTLQKLTRIKKDPWQGFFEVKQII